MLKNADVLNGSLDGLIKRKMKNLKEHPQVDKPRGSLLEKAPDALSTDELLSLLLDKVIKSKKSKQLSEQIIGKFGNNFLNITVDDLLDIPEIGKAKALKIVTAFALIKKFYEEFGLGIKPNAAGVVLLHSNLSSNVEPKKQEIEVISKTLEADCIIEKSVIDVDTVNNKYAILQALQEKTTHFISEGIQYSLFDLLEIEKPAYTTPIKKVHKFLIYSDNRETGRFQLQNRRYLGNKYKLLGFIEDIVNEKCNGFNVFCDIFAGTGVVAERFNNKNIKVIANDLLASNYIPLKTFLGISNIDFTEIEKKINLLNAIEATEDNYFSMNFGQTYFTLENARKIGAIREKIDELTSDENEKAVLITSLLYAVDKVANTVGHYDAYRKKMDSIQLLHLLVPDFEVENNVNNEIYKEDANHLIRKIYCDVLYIDPPYNSRQYSDAYHLLENLVTWNKPPVHGKAKKMDRSHIKSNYCLQSAPKIFADLIANANCKHILLSYNNTGESKDGRSNARISDEQIINILKSRGEVEIFERDYKAFSTGKSETDGNIERVFYCKVTK